jgi:phage repressor protein C with HTH and peptisase S24 domain
MSPTLEAGDLALVRVGSRVAPRDIALVRRAGHALVLHRIVRPAGARTWITQGDANPIPDLEAVSEPEIVGRVVAVLHVGRAASRCRGTVRATLANQSDSTGR